MNGSGVDGTDLAPTSGTFSSGSLRSNYGRQRWTDDAARAKFFEYGGNQRWPIVGGKRRWHQPNRNFPIHRPGQDAKPKSSVNLKNVFPPSLISFRVIAEMHWIEAQLLSDKNTQCRAAHTATRCALAITTVLPGIN